MSQHLSLWCFSFDHSLLIRLWIPQLLEVDSKISRLMLRQTKQLMEFHHPWWFPCIRWRKARRRATDFDGFKHRFQIKYLANLDNGTWQILRCWNHGKKPKRLINPADKKVKHIANHSRGLMVTYSWEQSSILKPWYRSISWRASTSSHYKPKAQNICDMSMAVLQSCVLWCHALSSCSYTHLPSPEQSSSINHDIRSNFWSNW